MCVLSLATVSAYGRSSRLGSAEVCVTLGRVRCSPGCAVTSRDQGDVTRAFVFVTCTSGKLMPSLMNIFSFDIQITGVEACRR